MIYGMNIIEFKPPKRERGCCWQLGEKQYEFKGAQINVIWHIEDRILIKKLLDSAVFLGRFVGIVGVLPRRGYG